MDGLTKFLTLVLVIASLGQLSSCAELVFHNDRYNGLGNWGPTQGAIDLSIIWLVGFAASFIIAISTRFLPVSRSFRIWSWCLTLAIVPLICIGFACLGSHG